jgi:tetratricopeptide (TPR) repeat protein
MLYRQSLLTRDNSDTARMHRLLQDVALAHLREADRHQRTVEAVELLGELFPYRGDDPNEWPRCAQLLAHAQAVLAHALRLTSPALSELLTRTGNYLWGRGLDVRLAQELYEQALSMRQRLYHGGDHPSVGTSLNNLANCLNELGKPELARELYEEALAMSRRLYEGDHRNVAQSLNNFASCLRALGEHDQGRELHEEALAMRRRLYEGDHSDVAQSLKYLAISLRAVGEHDRARELDEEALAMQHRLAERRLAPGS